MNAQPPEQGASPSSDLSGPAAVSLPRRLAAASYDAVLVVALWFLATALVLPLTGGEAVSPGNPWFQAWLATWAAGFFAISWTRGGQTLGMRAWRFRVVRDGGGAIGWRRAVARCLLAALSWAALGAGFWWSLFRRDRRAWHDLGSGTRLERVQGR